MEVVVKEALDRRIQPWSRCEWPRPTAVNSSGDSSSNISDSSGVLGTSTKTRFILTGPRWTVCGKRSETARAAETWMPTYCNAAFLPHIAAEYLDMNKYPVLTC
ncbi:hypothetical protein QE152_g31331 [Popillia japonica]|uniref:Uncharacterized protein n=1 Tax=Popillia japonica TaxID=7064 RepID=A0AAW1JBM8_POPJA